MIKARKYKFYSKWDRDILICSCLCSNPCCNKYKSCEVLEFKLNTFDDLEECLQNARSYKRHNGALRQK